mmetsp:Transcript_33471/g.87833  ORF Transcript_33471/g.87833 Transcript_33471/m.87833 type:complete len:243 (+) Transcript_33471:2927-3655(+)
MTAGSTFGMTGQAFSHSSDIVSSGVRHGCITVINTLGHTRRWWAPQGCIATASYAVGGIRTSATIAQVMAWLTDWCRGRRRIRLEIVVNRTLGRAGSISRNNVDAGDAVSGSGSKTANAALCVAWEALHGATQACCVREGRTVCLTRPIEEHLRAAAACPWPRPAAPAGALRVAKAALGRVNRIDVVRVGISLVCGRARSNAAMQRRVVDHPVMSARDAASIVGGSAASVALGVARHAEMST